jgi:putative FmdB family regulatory protein
MPIYAYECAKCGETVEYLQKMSDSPKKKCESCGGKLSKLMTAPAFHLKGGGWYKDGYASTKADTGSSDSGGADSGSASASSDD